MGALDDATERYNELAKEMSELRTLIWAIVRSIGGTVSISQKILEESKQDGITLSESSNADRGITITAEINPKPALSLGTVHQQ